MKLTMKAGNMLYPLPAVLVSTRGRDGKDNLLTVAWTGTINTNPPMVYISVRKSRYSYQALHETGVFVINLTTEDLARAADLCGVRSGRDLDKFAYCGLHKEEADQIDAALVEESPVNIECRVTEEKELGSHVMFLAEVLAVHADSAYMDEKETFHLEEAKPIVYSHGSYFSLGKELGRFGYSVRRRKKADPLDQADQKGKPKASDKPKTSGKLKASGKAKASGKPKVSGKPKAGKTGKTGKRKGSK